MVEDIEQDRDTRLFVDGKAVCRTEPSVVIFHDQAPVYRRVEVIVHPDETGDALYGIPVHAPDMELYLCGGVKPHQVEHGGMIGELSDTPLNDCCIRGIEDDKLVGVHRDPHAGSCDESANGCQRIPEVLLPREGADRVGRKRDHSGGDPKEEDVMPAVPRKDPFKAGDIAADR